MDSTWFSDLIARLASNGVTILSSVVAIGLGNRLLYPRPPSVVPPQPRGRVRRALQPRPRGPDPSHPLHDRWLDD